MNIKIREYNENDTDAVKEIWNQVVRDGIAFPQEEMLTCEEAEAFFKQQTYTGVAEDEDSGEIVGICWNRYGKGRFPYARRFL